MNKLKTKVFFTIFIIMTLFSTVITIITNIQNYNSERKRIENSLSRINENRPKHENIDLEENFLAPKDNNRMFIDQNVYTIELEDGEISRIISHSFDYTDAKKITKVANEILENKDKGIVVSNLFIDEYSYSYGDNMIIIVDNSQAKERLVTNLRISIIIFIVIELLIMLVTYFLTNWIIKPVEEAWKKQKDFIADASHELKTPLSVVMANAEMLENNPKEKKWLKNIQSESERMNKLITSLLDLAKLENSDNQGLYTEENLSKLIEKSILPFESLLYERKIKFNYEIEDKINLKCNQDEIKQLVAILLDNAIKHSEKNGEVNVSLKKEKQITLSVSNKGKEIKKEDLDHIFERFYRADKSRNRDENRYGLGLAIAKRIVENHNGKISCTSEKGLTTFKVTFK